MAKCALCDEIFLMRTDTREHVILNAIGGRKKVKGFLCGLCNSRSGHTWDADLAKQLNGLSLLFAINRERGSVVPQELKTVGGKTILLTEDGIRQTMPTYKISDNNGKVSIKIQARTYGEARKMLAGFKRKYRDIDVENTLARAVRQGFYHDDMIKFETQIGGQSSGRSVVKSALALASAAGVPPSHCEEARRYLKSGEDACFGYYYTRDLVQNRDSKKIMHCVVVKSTSDGLLLGYIEFFFNIQNSCLPIEKI